MENKEIAIQLSGVKKMYKLGQIGGGTLTADLQSWWARVRGKEDPNTKIGTDQRLIGQTFMALNGIDLTIYKGEALGIIGGNGAGKSTLANLLTRLYDVNSGAIFIDGVNVKDLPFDYLRQNVAIVSQETYLFRGSILDNIRYACPDATKEQVINAAKTASAHDFIIKMPDGYNTEIGFGKKELSGGEKQRISIARALLRNPKVLILDEATAAMDTQTERNIQAALDRLTKDRTTVIIAHRLSTLRNADNLIAIENGRVAESGTAEELLRQKGVYHKLYKLQAEALKNVGIGE